MIQSTTRRATWKVRPQPYRGLNHINIELLEPRRLLSAAASLVHPEVAFDIPAGSASIQNVGELNVHHAGENDWSPFSGAGLNGQQEPGGMSPGLLHPTVGTDGSGEIGWQTGSLTNPSAIDGGVLRPTSGLGSDPGALDGTLQDGYPAWHDPWASQVIVGIDPSSGSGSVVIADGEGRGFLEFGAPDGMAPPIVVNLAALWQQAIYELAGNSGATVFSNGTIYETSAGRALPKLDIAAPGIVIEQSETITFVQPADRVSAPIAPPADVDHIHAATDPVSTPAPTPAAPSVTPLALTPASTSSSPFVTTSAASPIPTVAARAQTTGAIQSLFPISRSSISARWTSSLGIVGNAAASPQAVAATTGAIEAAGGVVHVTGKIADGARQMLDIVADSPSLPAQVAYNFIHFDAAVFRDAVSMFANELATLPSSDVTAPSSARAWEITAAVLSFDAAFLAYWYRKSRQERRARRGLVAGALEAFGPRLM